MAYMGSLIQEKLIFIYVFSQKSIDIQSMDMKIMMFKNPYQKNIRHQFVYNP